MLLPLKVFYAMHGWDVHTVGYFWKHVLLTKKLLLNFVERRCVAASYKLRVGAVLQNIDK